MLIPTEPSDGTLKCEWIPAEPKRGFFTELREEVWWALLIVICLEAVAVASEAWPRVDRLVQLGRDWFMGFSVEDSVVRGQVPLAFIDIDNKSFRRWVDKGGTTDRAQVAKILEKVVGANVAAIVVDLDLSMRGTHDEYLTRFLAHYPDPKVQPVADATPIVFVQALKRTDDGTAASSSVLAPVSFAPNLLDGVAESGRPVFFASSGFLRDHDGVVRRWLLAEPVCRNEMPEVFPSAELMILAIISSLDATKNLDLSVRVSMARAVSSLRTALSASFQASSSCGVRTEGSVRRLDFGSHRVVELFPKDAGEWIHYTLPSSSPGADGYQGALLKRIPAWQFVDSAASQVSNDLTGRIVLIGGSNDESRDTYMTPIGKMPGAMVLLNAINTLQKGQLHELPIYFSFPIGVILGMVVWLCLKALRFGIALIVALAILFVLTRLLAAGMIPARAWIDFGAPVLGILVHGIYEALKEGKNDLKIYGLTALLAPEWRQEKRRADH